MARTTVAMTRWSLALLLFMLLPAAPARGEPLTFAAGMQAVLGEYLKIHAALIEDSSRGVTAAAQKIERLAERLAVEKLTGQHAARLRALPPKIRQAAGQLKQERLLAGQRAAFKALSRPLVLWATLSRPEGVRVAACEMEKASWLQRQAGIRNPYHGTKMLYCGEFVRRGP